VRFDTSNIEWSNFTRHFHSPPLLAHIFLKYILMLSSYLILGSRAVLKNTFKFFLHFLNNTFWQNSTIIFKEYVSTLYFNYVGLTRFKSFNLKKQYSETSTQTLLPYNGLKSSKHIVTCRLRVGISKSENNKDVHCWATAQWMFPRQPVRYRWKRHVAWEWKHVPEATRTWPVRWMPLHRKRERESFEKVSSRPSDRQR
jgi:hypothetical protein